MVPGQRELLAVPSLDQDLEGRRALVDKLHLDAGHSGISFQRRLKRVVGWEPGRRLRGDTDRRRTRLELGALPRKGALPVEPSSTAGQGDLRNAKRPGSRLGSSGRQLFASGGPAWRLCGRAGPGSRLESALERAFSVPARGPNSRVFDPS